MQFNSAQKNEVFDEEEDLEINRFLEMDFNVHCVELKESGKAVDNEMDLMKVRKIIEYRQK